MGEYDIINPGKTISKELTYDQKEFYNYLWSWFEERHYVVVEKEYSERINLEGKRVFFFQWWIEKKPEPLTKIVFELDSTAEVEDVQIALEDGSQRTAQKGVVSVTIRSEVVRDAYGDWKLTQERPYRRIIRELYVKVIKKNRIDKYAAMLTEDMRRVFGDLKTYFKTHRYD